MYRIGEFSAMCRVSVKNLRYYDEVGLLNPAYTDPATNYRYYTSDQLVRIHNIRSYQQVGLSIAEIKLLLRGKEEKAVLEARREELAREAAEISRQVEMLDFLCSGKTDEQLMNYKAVVKDVPGYIIYAKKMVIRDWSEYFEFVPQLGQAVTDINPGIQCGQPEYNFVVCLDGEYKEQNRRIEFCEAVDRFGVGPEGVEFKEIPPTTVVSVMHRGPYSTLDLAYAYAAAWVEKNGYLISDNPRESFIDGVWNKESEDEWLTEIQIPVMR